MDAVSFVFSASPETAGRGANVIIGVGDGLGQADRVFIALKGNDALEPPNTNFEAQQVSAILDYEFFDFSADSASFAFNLESIHITFPDVPENHWARGFIHYMARRGSVQGHPDGTFRPEDNITIAQFLAMTLVLAEAETQNFPDDYWSRPFLEWAINAEIIQGPFNYAAGNEYINRGFAFSVLYAIFSDPQTTSTWNRLQHTQPIRPYEMPFYDVDVMGFNDIIEALFQHGIVSGRPKTDEAGYQVLNENGHPILVADTSASITRAEITSLLFNTVTPHGEIRESDRELIINLVEGFSALSFFIARDPDSTEPTRVSTSLDDTFNTNGAQQFLFTTNLTGVYRFICSTGNTPRLFLAIGYTDAYDQARTRFEVMHPVPGGASNEFAISVDQRVVVEARGLFNQDFTIIADLVRGTGISEMQLSRREGGSFIYVNNPEWITDWDIIHPGNNRNHLIFRQDGVVGVNAMFLAQSTITPALTTLTGRGDVETPQPRQDFHLDISFFNNSSEYVTVLVYNPFWAVETGWSRFHRLGEVGLYRLENRNTRESVMVTIPPNQQKLLFRDIVYNEFGGSRGLIVPFYHAFIVIHADFEVLHGAGVSVNVLAAYESNFLYLSHNAEGHLVAGLTSPVEIYGAPFFHSRTLPGSDLVRHETTVSGVYKGIDRGHLDIIEGHMSFVIDDTFEAGGNLAIIQNDQFYTHRTARWSWFTHSNPLSVYYGYGDRINTMPYDLHRFVYDDRIYDAIYNNDGTITWVYRKSGEWRFRFDYLRPLSILEEGVRRASLDRLDPNIYADLHTGAFNPRISEEFLMFFQDVSSGTRYSSDPNSNPWEVPLPYNIYHSNWADITWSLGSWGVTYEFTIDITNLGEVDRELQYFLTFYDGTALHYRVYRNGIEIGSHGRVKNNAVDYGQRNSIPIFVNSDDESQPLVLTPHSSYKIVVSMILGVGSGGYNHRLAIVN
jgi:hypothetical protein